MASLKSNEILGWQKSGSSSSSTCFTKGEVVRLPALTLNLGRSKIQMIGAELTVTGRDGGFARTVEPRILSAASERFSSPKTGSVGADRFKDETVPGTYWNDSLDLGGEVVVNFNSGSKNVIVNCRAGDNLLRLAEGCGVMIPNLDFCFEGTCCHCEMEVLGGAIEVGYRADPSGSDLIRSCICPVPQGRRTLDVNILSDEGVWGEAVL